MTMIEIAVQDVAGARIAAREGADRIELCAALGATGGLTPSAGMIAACAAVGVPRGVQALVRPRAGSFVFDDDEKAVQLADVRGAVLAGASGVVVGGLDADGNVDAPFAAALADAARRVGLESGRDVEVTFHRAFDMVPDRTAALETLIGLGYTRVLTSGGAPDVIAGLPELRALVALAGGRIQIEAGGGLTVAAIPSVAGVGVDALHMSARRLVPSHGGPGGGGDAPVERTDADVVRAAVAAAHGV
ncbi:copper homeostasis protein CutC [Bifidobacterium platyrrhinorum]|uniref:PF03932 family protein CutC n=1 Tax=Bifidobacterium platyrrhinorum TaxID=2661628 RepID=A0A6L9SSA4_9BIFI|nr:copper homeostasis protein CutC [Bifidobacterium platyrrhinorum]NEG54402.1 copper homeostasis protein CutC [Bifidobacterium platyrrhinorum]